MNQHEHDGEPSAPLVHIGEVLDEVLPTTRPSRPLVEDGEAGGLHKLHNIVDGRPIFARDGAGHTIRAHSITSLRPIGAILGQRRSNLTPMTLLSAFTIA